MKLKNKLRRIVNRYVKKEEINKKRLIRKYKKIIIRTLKYNAKNNGVIYSNTYVPKSICNDLEEIFKEQGFKVIEDDCISITEKKLTIIDIEDER